jgi:mannosyltransferase OCH1-like enzyme
MCINTWRRVCPEYEVILWNEENLEMDGLMKTNAFFNECIKRGLWAFASDYLRLYILYNEGGIYLDTDVEVVKPFDSLLEYSFFVGLENGDYIGTGVIGAEIQSREVKRLLEFYEKEIWNVDFYNNPIIFKNLIQKEPDTFASCTVLPQDYFSPYTPGDSHNELIGTDNTLCIHWYNASWGMNRAGYVFLQTKHIKKPIEKIYQVLRKNIGYYRKRKSLNQ